MGGVGWWKVGVPEAVGLEPARVPRAVAVLVAVQVAVLVHPCPCESTSPRPRRKSKNPVDTGFLSGAEGRNRTGHTMIFSHVLYQLSYLGKARLERRI